MNNRAKQSLAAVLLCDFLATDFFQGPKHIEYTAMNNNNLQFLDHRLLAKGVAAEGPVLCKYNTDLRLW